MHDKSLDEFVREHKYLGSRLGPDATADKFTVHSLNLPDTFQVLKYRVMEYFESKGYKCNKEKPFFNPNARKMYFKDSDNRLAIIAEVKHEKYAARFKERDLGRAHVIIKKRFSAR